MLVNVFGAFPCFRSMKRILEQLLLPGGGDDTPIQATLEVLFKFPWQFAGTCLLCWVGRGTVKMCRPRTEDSDSNQGSNPDHLIQCPANLEPRGQGSRLMSSALTVRPTCFK